MMKNPLRLAALVILSGAAFMPNSARAAPPDCARLLGQGDRYYFCRAEVERKDVFCASITDAALRRTCRALTRHDPSECDSISNIDQRTLCRARVF